MKSAMWLKCVIGLSLTVAAAHAETLERRTAAQPDGEVEIVNVAGEVNIKGWERAEVRVTADLGSGVERLEFTNSGARTSINVVLKRRGSAGASELTVYVPRASTLQINTVSADQNIEAVRGVQRLQSVSGSIATEAWGEFQIKTISGDVTVQGRDVPAVSAVTTVSGDITLNKIAGELALETVTGDMQITMNALGRGNIRTTNGDLVLRATVSKDTRLDAEAINGDLRFVLKGSNDADFDIETFNGAIDSCFGPEPQRTREFAPGNALRFKQGAGSAKIRIKTLNGGVELC